MKLDLPLKIQGVVYSLLTQYPFMPQYFACKQAKIE